MIRANIEKDGEATMVLFLAGFNSKIGEEVELQYYVELGDWVDKIIKVEEQLKAKRLRSDLSSSSSVNWRHNLAFKEKGKRTMPKLKQLVKCKEETSQTPQPRNKSERLQKSRDLKCFRYQGIGHIASQCPNKRVMIVRDDGEIENTSSSDDDMPLLDSESDVKKGPGCGDTLITRKTCWTEPKGDGDQL